MDQANANRRKASVLIVDDTPENLTLMRGLLKDDYRTLLANNGEAALTIARASEPPDIILLDVMMPGIDGYDVCTRLRSDPRTAGIPIIFLTAKSQVEDEEKGFRLGAVDYITKPISPPIVLARVQTHLLLKKARDFLVDQNAYLEREVATRTEEVVRRTQQLAEVQDVTIFAMASLAETRDNETGNHIRRTQHYVKLLARELSRRDAFRDALTEDIIDLLFKSAPLHDIGKVGIPDRILLKPGKLTPEEFEVMKTHTIIGRDAIVAAESQLKTSSSFLRIAREIAYGHQEKWDGSGYPDGLAGTAIPLSARLMALADVYDALISRRVYKAPFPHDKAVQIITAGRGKHFDPTMVDAFVEISEQFHQIALQYQDTEQDLHAKAAVREPGA